MEFLQKIDWSLLSQQKVTLLDLRESTSLNDSDIEALDGVIALLDSMQDYAIDHMGVSEDVVFSSTEE